MKLVGVENNIVNTDNSNEDFLIISDQPIKKYSYYFELEATSTFGLYCAAAVAFVEKNENNEFVKDNTIREIGEYETTNSYDINFTDSNSATRQHYRNSLNLELDYRINVGSGRYRDSNLCELSIIDDKNNFKYSSVYESYSYYSYYNYHTKFYRLGLGIDIDLDNKITTLKYYYDGIHLSTINKNEKLLGAQLSINKIFDPDRLYIVIYPQYLTLKKNGYNTDYTRKIINRANYKFFFKKDEIKYTHLYEKYNHPATVVEKLGGGVWQNERQ